MRTHAIIVAAGSGSRFGMPKQLAPLGGVPLYRHSLEVFALLPNIETIVLVVANDIRSVIEQEIATLPYSKKIIITEGGASRQASVMNGLRTITDASDNDIILVHDAARPGVTAEIITTVIAAAEEYGAAIAALPVVDTLKQERKHLAIATLSRAHLWRAQTPQAASYSTLMKALERAQEDAFEGTDEAELLEWVGVHARIVLGAERSMKVTYPEDLKLVEILMKS